MTTDLLTSRQAAERLSVTVTTINRMVADGRLTPAMQIAGYNGARLFSAEAVDALRKAAS